MNHLTAESGPTGRKTRITACLATFIATAFAALSSGTMSFASTASSVQALSPAYSGTVTNQGYGATTDLTLANVKETQAPNSSAVLTGDVTVAPGSAIVPESDSFTGIITGTTVTLTITQDQASACEAGGCTAVYVGSVGSDGSITGYYSYYNTTAGVDGTQSGVWSVSPALVNTVAPATSGTAQDGHVVSTTTGTWLAPSKITYSYQWQLCDSNGAGCADIAGATGRSYKLNSADVGRFVTVVVTAADASEQTGKVAATPAGPVADPPPPANTAVPMISGTVAADDTLRTKTGTWSSPDTLTYSYQWERCDSAGTTCTDIEDANAQTFKLTSADVAGEVTVQVTATDAEGQTGEATAAPVS